MSASREKKQRLKTEGLSEKERKQAIEEQEEKRRIKIYMVIGVIISLLVVALLVWNTGFFQRNATAVTVGDEKFTVGDLSYYYHSIENTTASYAKTYAQYGIDTGYDPDTSPDEQIYDQEAGTTYADYFRQTAVDSLQQVALLCSEAETAGYTLSEDGQSSVDDTISQIDTYASQYNYSESAYLKLLYGKYVTKATVVKQLTMSTLASEYQTYYTDSLTYTDEQLNDYYQQNSADLDTYDFRYCFISGTAASTTDADGNTVDPTDEEKAAALADAKSKADEMVEKYRAGGEFNALAAEYVDESTASSYSDPEYNHVTDKLGSEISSSAYGSWLMDSSRQPGEIGVVDASSSTSGYYVVLLSSRQRLDNSYETVDVRHILITAETDAADSSSTDSSSTDSSSTDSSSTDSSSTDVLPTEEQLSAAYAKAQSLLDEWKAGAATADSFGQLANLYSDDTGSNTNGGLYTAVERGTMIDSFNDWIFTPGRQPGDTGIVVNTNGTTDDVRGYHVMYFQAAGEVRWKYEARTAMASTDYTTWYDNAKENYAVTTSDFGMSMVK